MPETTPIDCVTAAVANLSRALHSLLPPPSQFSTSAQPHPPIASIVREIHEVISMYTPSSTQIATNLPSPSTLSSQLPPQVQRVPTSHDSLVVPPPLPEPVPNSIPSSHLPNIPFPTNTLTVYTHTKPLSPPASPLNVPLHTVNFATLNLDTTGQPLTYNTALQGPDRAHWIAAEAEEFDRLFATETITPIHTTDQPIDRRKDTTYYNPQVKQKQDDSGRVTYRIRGTIGGDRINYPGQTTALTAAMPVVKLLLQSAISENMHVLTMDAKDFYLNTPLTRPEYLRIPLKFIAPCVLDKHHLRPYIDKKAILFSVHRGMYGLPQAGYLAQIQLIKHLRAHGYEQTNTPPLPFSSRV